MKSQTFRLLALALLGSALVTTAGQGQERPQVAIPQSGVPEIMTIEGEYVRAAYNNEGYVILGYRVANNSLGEEWMLLEVGSTVREGVPNYKLTRAAISLDTPDGQKLPMPTNQDYMQVDLRALEQRSKVVRDSINYFPPMASSACRIGFFSDIESRTMAYDQVELSQHRACLGRLYFKIPGGIKYGQHWLNGSSPTAWCACRSGSSPTRRRRHCRRTTATSASRCRTRSRRRSRPVPGPGTSRA